MSLSDPPHSPFSYLDRGKTPDRYVCGDCGTSGVRLYREYQTFLEQQKLHCRTCACKGQKKQPDSEHEHSIGWLVAAVPSEDGETYWGFTSVPQEGVEWWDALPKTPVLILARPAWMIGSEECDWPEDAPHENGQYFCKCICCSSDFIGHKRRFICRRCQEVSDKVLADMTPEERAAHEAKRDAAIEEYWKEHRQ